MKLTTLTLTALALSGPALAGGMAPPIAEQPPVTVTAPTTGFDWSGIYLGGGFSRFTHEERGERTTGGCPDKEQFILRTFTVPTCPPEETVGYSYNVETDAAHVFAAARHQFASGVVIGGRVTYTFTDDPMTQFEGQIGYGLDRVLPYVAAGVTDTDDTFAVIGADFAVTDSLVIGARATQFESGATGFGIEAAVRF